MENLTESEAQQSLCWGVIHTLKVPPACADASVGRLQGFSSVPAMSALLFLQR